jgi:hypothetical protein
VSDDFDDVISGLPAAIPYDTSSSLLAGMSTQQLQQYLTAAQAAYVQLSLGSKGESFSYTQGDGTKTVTYTRAQLPQLANLIQMLQSQLGIVCRARRPMRPLFL